MELATLHKLVEAIYTDKRLRQLLGKLQPADLRDDLLHHVIERIYKFNEQHPERIAELASKDKVFCIYVGANEQREQQLFAWLVGNMKMELFSPRSPFSRKYRRIFEELPSWTTNMPQDEYAKPDLAAIYSQLVARGGNGFAAAVWDEIERQEALRVANHGQEKQKATKPLQIDLF